MMTPSLRSTLLILGLLALAPPARALSPTDNYRQHAEDRRTGELVYLSEDVTLEEARALLEAARPALAQSLHAQGGSNLSVFAMEDVDGKTILLAHREDPPGQKPSRLDWPEPLRNRLVAHEHAGRQRLGEQHWLDMELICHLPCAADKEPDGEVARFGLVTRLRPDKEGTYRTLHQTVWPGVIDQITRSNTRHWTTWCVEIAGQLYLVAYCEYVGTDKAADDADMASDPVTQRWWKLTDACQQPLPQQEGKGGPWSAMTLLLHIP